MQVVRHFHFLLLIFFQLLLFIDAVDYAYEFYALTLVVTGRNGSAGGKVGKAAFPRAHLIRVPKASSSSLSIVVRRMAGCKPAGPCCKWPGDPPGSCPSKDLYACQAEGKVIGCTHHHPNYELFRDETIPSISMLREPKSRAISAFFYPGIHHNSKCTGDQQSCFLEYTASYRWQNIAVKMLTGLYSYGNEPTCTFKRECKRSLELAFENLGALAFIGIAEMWELSLAILHVKLPNFIPSLDEYRLATPSNSSSKTATSKPGTRANQDRSYSEFKRIAKERYAAELEKQNSLDVKLYEKVIDMMCGDLHRYNLWSFQLVRQYWSEKSLYKTLLCP